MDGWGQQVNTKRTSDTQAAWQPVDLDLENTSGRCSCLQGFKLIHFTRLRHDHMLHASSSIHSPIVPLTHSYSLLPTHFMAHGPSFSLLRGTTMT
jgi:hypothetical protein